MINKVIYDDVDPPLAIPNREVKYANADGTAISRRVGKCLPGSKQG